MPDNIIRNGDGQPVVPQGVQPAMNAAPKDTLPHPVPPGPDRSNQMPEPNSPQMIRESVPQKAVEATTTFEELAAKKGFKSADELAKAYASLESQNKRVEATLSDAIKARQEAQPVYYEEQIRVEEAQTNEDALRIVDQRISKQMRSELDKLYYQMHIMQHPNDRKYAEDAFKYVRENPGISWDVAFKAARADHIEDFRSQGEERGREEAYSSISTKEQAQSLPSTSQREQPLTIKDLTEGVRTGRIPLGEARRLINTLGSN